ncbi:MAG: hypothetical protein HFH01_04635 [Dorea sp.]|nr:hypothetical protein [Dorea sp.]
MRKKRGKERLIRLRPLFLLALCFLLPCGGCSGQRGESPAKKYTADELDNLALLKVYLPDSSEPEKIIRDEEILYQYNHCFPSDSASYSEERQAEWEKTADSAAEKYHIVSYKYPVSRLHKGELEKNMTITIYEDTDVIKIEVSEESMKGVPVPVEYLVFYSEGSDEETEFYHSLLDE